MITLKDNKGNKYDFTLSKFPDKTSQAWQITPEPPRMSTIEVLWMFEDEAELVTILQLGVLLYKHFFCFPTLNMPYLVYGRQDKKVTNTSTFARDVMIQLVSQSGYTRIKSYDAHSGSVYVESRQPTELISRALQDGYDVVCFPDKGAAARYKDLLPKDMLIIYGIKVRNQLTGEIEGLDVEYDGLVISEFLKVLVIDDICDGGRTFTELALRLKDLPTKLTLGLAVSHGLFTKGLDILGEAGYNTIYTTNSLLKNEVGSSYHSVSSLGGKLINYEYEIEVVNILE